jgi:hypothetical protein
MNFELSAREVEVALRWSEVNCDKLMEHIREDPELNEKSNYLFESDQIAVYIHTLKEHKHDVDRRIKLIAYYPPYKHDKYFSVIIQHIYQLQTLRSHFEPLIGKKGLCPCGRLGRFHLLEIENGKCNNCYIYGMVRGEECSICKEDDGKPWLKTSCGHHFHDTCWYKISENEYEERKCPLCRSVQTNKDIKKL